jgi:hypothetical protein
VLLLDDGWAEAVGSTLRLSGEAFGVGTTSLPAPQAFTSRRNPRVILAIEGLRSTTARQRLRWSNPKGRSTRRLPELPLTVRSRRPRGPSTRFWLLPQGLATASGPG